MFNNANRTFDQLRNYAVEKSAGEYLIFLDSTVKPENKQWLSELVNETIDNNTGLVGGKILDNKKRVLNAGMWFEFDTQEVHYTHRGCQADNIGYYYRLVLPQNVFAVSDECMLIKKIFLNK
ncbi:glycosyltransferase [Eubacterium callanderi]|uniref:Glycosyltransferase n=1 Tax=Eubacterium callanderi TaxID=53442 RepID=A0A853JUQ5_9FIRM|nr:glycosyltransferase [Eubacterium callanderi]